ncbi:MAG TPA: hypothetical protein VH120_17330 [Gemmataceae bacterium]|nr:hypothetical protein [Gemmataceae bacterium]
MRRVARWVGGLAGLVLFAGGLMAQDAKDATVKAPSAEVRGGRSEVFPITGYLRQGQAVRVVNEDGGFCAIVPPAGSSNWIEDHAVKPMDAPGGRRADKAYVLLDGVSVRLGSDRSPGPLPYETVKLSRGTIVRIIGDKAFAEGKEWWPIQPPPAEVRYVSKDALSQPTSTVVAASPVNPSAPKTGPGQQFHPLWVQAQQAEQVHDYSRAELLYRQLAGEMAQPGGDHDLAIRCYNRIEQLGRAQPVTWPARQQAPGMLVSSRPMTPPAGPAVPPSGSISSGPGWLRRTGILLDGKPAYVLEDNRGQPRYYVLAAPGQTLDSYVNRAVDVTGPLTNRPDFVTGGYITVYRVSLLR